MAAMQVACTGRDRLKAVGARARAERTQNMPAMVVTLDVSKLSGWLNAVARCRVERRACDVGRGIRPGRREGVGWRRRMRRARGGPDSRLGGARARASNMPCMVVTLDVSQLEMSALKFFKLWKR